MGASHEMALLDFFGCTEVDVAFTVDVVPAVGLDSAMIVIFDLVKLILGFAHNATEKPD